MPPQDACQQLTNRHEHFLKYYPVTITGFNRAYHVNALTTPLMGF